MTQQPWSWATVPKRNENIYLQTCWCRKVHTGTVRTSQKAETTQINTSWWMDKCMWYMATVGCYSAMRRKEVPTRYRMEESWKHDAQEEKPVTYCMLPSHEMSRTGDSRDRKYMTCCLGSVGGGERCGGWAVTANERGVPSRGDVMFQNEAVRMGTQLEYTKTHWTVHFK